MKEKTAWLKRLMGKDGRSGAAEPDVQGIRQEDVDRLLARARAETRERTEQAVRRDLAEEIGRSALPQVLPDYPSRENFEICGLVSPGYEASCCFYDYFYIDPGLLCASIGQVPGGGVPEALYMVVAQTTVRSRLRQGRSLAETMADVNAQLYDLGSRQPFNALVGTLNTADGRFYYINAGQAIPLLMRNEGRCEWLETPVYAPLGMNENVAYRTMDLRLKQGDRLGYGALLLEFQKGDKELAHCEVPGQPEYAREVSQFLKKQFLDNGISQRHGARTMVVVDEIFALCCRHAAAEGSTVMVECGIAPDAQMVNIRVAAMLGGASPLEDAAQGPDMEAAGFIQEQADYVTFKPGGTGGERDTLTVVCFLGP